MDYTEAYRIVDKRRDKFAEIIEKHFPNLFEAKERESYSGGMLTAELSESNEPFKNTPYFFNEEMSFVHWTSIENLLSIINYREIRLYNLNSSKDPLELEYSAKIFKVEEQDIANLKYHNFTFSFCKSSDLKNPYLWKHYGNDFKGVAIKFSIVNDPLKWQKYILSKIYYDIPEAFDKFLKEVEEFEKQEGTGVIARLKLDKLYGFHKQKSYEGENEIRLSILHPFDFTQEYQKHSKMDWRIDGQRNRITKYISLPLWVDNDKVAKDREKPELDLISPFDDSHFIDKPKLKIENIYFGKNCGLGIEEFGVFTNELKELIDLSFGYRLDDLGPNLYDTAE